MDIITTDLHLHPRAGKTNFDMGGVLQVGFGDVAVVLQV